MMMLTMGLIGFALLGGESARVARARHRAGVAAPPVPAVRPRVEGPTVTMLVPAWNAREELGPFVEAFRKLSYPSLELVLCVGGDDGTYETAMQYVSDSVIVIRQEPTDGKQGGLRKAYAAASGDIIYLTDIDCRVSDEALFSLLDMLAVPNVSVVTGSSMPRDRDVSNPFVAVQWAVERSVRAAEEPHQVSGLLGRNAALRRAVIEETGRFGFSAPTGTDYTLAKEILRRGYAIWYCPGSCVATEYPETFARYLKKQRRWLGNVLKFGIQYAAWRDVLAVSRTLAMAVALAGALVAGGSWPWAWLIVFGILVHAAANRWKAVRACRLRPRPLAIVAHIVADQAAALAAGWAVARGDLRW